MNSNDHKYDVIIVGAGPIGIACGIAAKRRGLDALIIEKGALVNSFVHYPTDLELFSTPELLEIGGYPFVSRNYKPVRAEALEYYRRTAEAEQLNFRLYERVERIDGADESFRIVTTKGTYLSRKVVLATGFFDVPNGLGVPGEELPHVIHYYKEPYPFTGQRIVIIGAKNSAAKVALECVRHGADVTLVHRGQAISDSVKYWIKPDLENRIKEGRIKAHFNTRVTEIRPGEIEVVSAEGRRTLPADWVLAMTGYQPDFGMLEAFGLDFEQDEWRTPVHDRTTMETNRAGLYLAGVVCGGLNTRVWFVENSRIHAEIVMDHIAIGRPTLDPPAPIAPELQD